MTTMPHRILQLNGTATAACAVGLLATRATLYPHFGLDSPVLFDILSIGLAAYAGALFIVAARRPVTREALMFFTIVDAAWVAGSAAVLVLFWAQLDPVARILIALVAFAVEAFAALQFRAAGTVARQSHGLA